MHNIQKAAVASSTFEIVLDQDGTKNCFLKFPFDDFIEEIQKQKYIIAEN